ncbi:MAG: hypothetical protein V1923_05860 [Candidatus Omnitrophota bacterium]
MGYSRRPFLFRSRTSDRRSSILMLALWSLCILSVFAVILNYTVRQKITFVRRLDSRDRAHLGAEAGVKKAIIYLKKLENTGPKAYLALKNLMARESESVEGNRWEIRDEERKINMNLAGLPELARLFQVAACMNEIEAQDLASCIIDWRDSDSALSSASGGAEDPYYRNTSVPYEAKDAPFEVLDEILLVKGMNQDIFEKIKSLLTLYGDGKVNINTASSEALLALGLDLGTVDKVLIFRQGKDGLEATEDDNIFDSPERIVSLLGEAVNLTPAEVAKLTHLSQNFLTTQSGYFMIDSRASSSTASDVEVLCIVDSEGEILYWRES